MKKRLALFLAIAIILTLLPQIAFSAAAGGIPPIKTGLEGKIISILGDSISTYTGVSNNTAYNPTLEGGAIYYTAGRYGVYQADTWWQQAIDQLGMELTVNNSWSGSCIFNTRAGTVGAYIDRSVQLHNTAGEEPDIIAVYLGTNDFCNYKTTLGTAAAIDYAALITETGDGYAYAAPTTAAEAYAIMLHKAKVRYPNAEIYCFTLLPQRISTSNTQLLEQFNQTLLAIAAHFGAYGVDLYNRSGIKNDANFQTYVADNSLHPGPAGMDAITGCFISSMLENSQYVTGEVRSITYDLDNVIVDQGTTYAVMDGNAFSCTFTKPIGYDLAVTVAMGGTDVTASSYAEGKVTIAAVTGDVVITASAAIPVKDAENYRWEFDGSELVSVEADNNTSNALTRLAGSITYGVHKASRFQMNEDVVLYHDRPWMLEWKSTGTWTDTTDGALLFAGAKTSNTADTPYLYRRHKSDFIALGVYTGGQYHNYGVALGAKGINATADHVYRMVNRIADNGTNMVYLYVDGVEIGSMNHHWIGGNDKKETVDWVNGRDFVFSYMGTTPHTIGGCAIDYIYVVECCHTYENGVCSACGEQQPDILIAVQPEGIQAAQGEAFSITVEAEGAGLKYQWYYRNAGSDTFRKAFSKGATFEATMNRIRAGREMYCVITDASGNTVTTDTVKLIRIPKAELKITQEPESVTAKPGEEFTVTVEAEGEDLTYRWFYRNPGEEAFRSFTTGSNTYTAKMNTARAGRELYCVVTDALGNQAATQMVQLILIPEEP